MTKSPSKARPRPGGDGLFVFLFFAAVTAYIHRGVLSTLSTHVLSGHQTGGQYVWQFWWWAKAIREGIPLFHTKLLMYPDGVPLFFHSLWTEGVALLLQRVLPPTAAFNLLMMGTYILTGGAGYLFLRRLSGSGPAALCGAFAFAFSEYMLIEHRHGHVIETNLFAAPLLAWAYLRYAAHQTRPNALILGASLSVVVLSGPYTAFSLGVAFMLLALTYHAWRREGLFHGFRRRTLGEFLLWVALPPVVAGLVFYWPLISEGGGWIGGASSFPTFALSFVDLPFWHHAGWVRALRVLPGAELFPEMKMAYLGVTGITVLGVIVGRRLWRRPEIAFWLWIFAGASILALGPTLRISPTVSWGIPLPYAVFNLLPGFSDFRVPARMLMTSTFALSALTALVLAPLFAKLTARWRWPVAMVIVGAIFWEFDLGVVGRRVAPAAPPRPYAMITADKGSEAVLPLPLYYSEEGDIYNFAQYYMLLQLTHGHPMVLGHPSRWKRENLRFTDTADVVRELTHPWLLEDLEKNPELSSRRAWLVENGSRRIKELGIGWVAYHQSLPGLNEETRRRLLLLLDQMFSGGGEVGEDGTIVYATGR